MKLTIELVPKTSWYSNLRAVMTQGQWDRLRKETYAKFNHACGICAANERLECHEIWEYDDVNKTQTLVGFIALCSPCHQIKHIGLTGIRAQRGELDWNRVVRHFISVNECSADEFARQKVAALKMWAERSQHQWDIRLGEYEELV